MRRIIDKGASFSSLPFSLMKVGRLPYFFVFAAPEERPCTEKGKRGRGKKEVCAAPSLMDHHGSLSLSLFLFPTLLLYFS